MRARRGATALVAALLPLVALVACSTGEPSTDAQIQDDPIATHLPVGAVLASSSRTGDGSASSAEHWSTRVLELAGGDPATVLAEAAAVAEGAGWEVTSGSPGSFGGQRTTATGELLRLRVSTQEHPPPVKLVISVTHVERPEAQPATGG